MRHDDILVGRADAGGPKRGALFGAAFRRLAGIRPAGFAAALMTAAMCGVVVNALFLQRERHPAPLFGDAPRTVVTPTPAPVVPAPASLHPPAAVAEAPSAPATPPVRPADISVPEAAPPAHHADPIADLLKGARDSKEIQRQTLAAQTALVKLGYVLKADGQAGADTMNALHEFEKAHGLPASSEITAKVVKALNAALQADH